MDWIGLGLGWDGMDLCVGLLYEHSFAVLIIITSPKVNNIPPKVNNLGPN